MKQKHTPTSLAVFLVVSTALVTGLTKADLTTDRKNKLVMHAQKLDANDDGAISFYKLTESQDRRFAELDRKENRIIEEHDFNARLITKFHWMNLNRVFVATSSHLPRSERIKVAHVCRVIFAYSSL